VNCPRSQCLAVANGAIGKRDWQIGVDVVTVGGSLNGRREVVVSTADRDVRHTINHRRLSVHSKPVTQDAASVADDINSVCEIDIFAVNKITPGVESSTLGVCSRLAGQLQRTADGARGGVSANDTEDHCAAVGGRRWRRDESQRGRAAINEPRVSVLRRVAVLVTGLHEQRVVALRAEVVERHREVAGDREGRSRRLDGAGARRRHVVLPRYRDCHAAVPRGDGEGQRWRQEARQTRRTEVIGSALVTQGSRPVWTVAVTQSYNSQCRRSTSIFILYCFTLLQAIR